MTFVVTEACIRCKYTDCVDVCPVDAFREGPNFLVIDPDDCIDCAVCVPECPVNAIFGEEDVPTDQQHFTALNAELARDWKPITRTKLALPDADAWSRIESDVYKRQPPGHRQEFGLFASDVPLIPLGEPAQVVLGEQHRLACRHLREHRTQRLPACLEFTMLDVYKRQRWRRRSRRTPACGVSAGGPGPRHAAAPAYRAAGCAAAHHSAAPPVATAPGWHGVPGR